MERVIGVDGEDGEDVQAEQAIEEMILGATVGAEAGSPTDQPPVVGPGIDDLIAEPLATGKAPNATAGATAAAAAAGAQPGTAAALPPSGAPAGPGAEPVQAEPGSPWRASAAPAAGAPEPADQPLSIGKMVLIALVTAIVVIVLGVWWTRRQVVLRTDVPMPETASAAGAAAPTAIAPPTASAAATGDGSAQPTSSAAAPGADSDARDGADLPAQKGLLRILFDGPPGGEVFLYGKFIGAVGEKLEVPCGRAFVRVGKRPGPSWLSAGASVEVKCQAVTEARVEPL